MAPNFSRNLRNSRLTFLGYKTGSDFCETLPNVAKLSEFFRFFPFGKATKNAQVITRKAIVIFEVRVDALSLRQVANSRFAGTDSRFIRRGLSAGSLYATIDQAAGNSLINR